MSSGAAITPEDRESAVRRLRSMLRWTNPSAGLRRAVQIGVEAILAIAPTARLQGRIDWSATSNPRERLTVAMEQCPINAHRARQLRAGAMTTSLEDCAIQAITHALSERTDHE